MIPWLPSPKRRREGEFWSHLQNDGEDGGVSAGKMVYNTWVKTLVFLKQCPTQIYQHNWLAWIFSLYLSNIHSGCSVTYVTTFFIWPLWKQTSAHSIVQVQLKLYWKKLRQSGCMHPIKYYKKGKQFRRKWQARWQNNVTRAEFTGPLKNKTPLLGKGFAIWIILSSKSDNNEKLPSTQPSHWPSSNLFAAIQQLFPVVIEQGF